MIPPSLILVVNSLFVGLGLDEAVEPICVRFVNTVGNRRSNDPSEHLRSTEDVVKFFAGHLLAPGDLSLDQEYHRRARHLRDGLYRIFSALAAGKPVSAEDIEILNAELAEATAKFELGAGLTWQLSEADPAERALMLIALSAADLVNSDLRSRIRECADEHCGWIFVDCSKNRSRRWCSMSDCGNLAKARRFQERRRSRVQKATI